MLYNWLKLYLKIFLRYFFALPLVGGRRLFGSEIFIKNLDFWIHYVKNHHFFSLGISYWPRFISLVLLLVKRQYSLDLLRAVFHKSFRIVRKQYPKYCVDNIINHWFIRRLCIHGDMKHLVAFLSTQEARVAPGCASSNSYASLVFSKLSSCFISPWTHPNVWMYR